MGGSQAATRPTRSASWPCPKAVAGLQRRCSGGDGRRAAVGGGAFQSSSSTPAAQAVWASLVEARRTFCVLWFSAHGGCTGAAVSLYRDHIQTRKPLVHDIEIRYLSSSLDIVHSLLPSRDYTKCNSIFVEPSPAEASACTLSSARNVRERQRAACSRQRSLDGPLWAQSLALLRGGQC